MIEELKPIKESFSQKHSAYFGSIWTLSLWIGGIYAFFSWIKSLFEAAADSNIIGFIFVFILQGFIMAVTTIFSAATLWVIIVFLTIVPYLMYRGLTK